MCSCQNVYPNIYASVLISHMICEKNSYRIHQQPNQLENNFDKDKQQCKFL